jgi:hypothetical protein
MVDGIRWFSKSSGGSGVDMQWRRKLIRWTVDGMVDGMVRDG